MSANSEREVIRFREPRRLTRRLATLAIMALVLAGNTARTVSAHHHAPASGTAGARSAVGFRSRELLDEHYRKHGREFGSVSRAGYLAIARALRDRPVDGAVVEIVRADGVFTRFDRGSGTFVAFDRSGVIRTCFKPVDGERYFRRQAERGRRER